MKYVQRGTEGQLTIFLTCLLNLPFIPQPGVAARNLGCGCVAPPAQATRVRPLSRAPKDAPLLCAAEQGRSLGRGFFVHVREPIASVANDLVSGSFFGMVTLPLQLTHATLEIVV